MVLGGRPPGRVGRRRISQCECPRLAGALDVFGLTCLAMPEQPRPRRPRPGSSGDGSRRAEVGPRGRRVGRRARAVVEVRRAGRPVDRQAGQPAVLGVTGRTSGIGSAARRAGPDRARPGLRAAPVEWRKVRRPEAELVGWRESVGAGRAQRSGGSGQVARGRVHRRRQARRRVEVGDRGRVAEVAARGRARRVARGWLEVGDVRWRWSGGSRSGTSGGGWSGGARRTGVGPAGRAGAGARRPSAGDVPTTARSVVLVPAVPPPPGAEVLARRDRSSGPTRDRRRTTAGRAPLNRRSDAASGSPGPPTGGASAPARSRRSVVAPGRPVGTRGLDRRRPGAGGRRRRRGPGQRAASRRVERPARQGARRAGGRARASRGCQAGVQAR